MAKRTSSWIFQRQLRLKTNSKEMGEEQNRDERELEGEIGGKCT